MRKGAYRGDLNIVEEVLVDLPAGERLLLIDDLDDDDGFAALHLAAIRGHGHVLKRLIGLRADVDVTTRDGDTPLMWAAHLGKQKICEEILRCGADASVKNKTKTAASQAKNAGHRRISELLDNHAFDVAAGLRRKSSSLEQAAAARRAANLAMLEQSAKAAKEKEDEDAFWAGIRARQKGREARGEDINSAARAALAAEAQAEAAKRQAEKAEEDSLATLPLGMRAHYKTLDLDADAGEAEVRKAYRKQALKHHPDKNPQDPVGAKERFNKLAVTYEAICEYLASVPAPKGARVAPPSNY